MNELKPCPFCPDGKFEDVLFYDGVFYAHCDKCGITIQGEGADESEFIEHLNNRPLEEALQKRLDEADKYKKAWRNAQNKRVEIFKHYDELKSAIRKARDEIADMCGNGAMFAGRVLDEYLGDYLPKEYE